MDSIFDEMCSHTKPGFLCFAAGDKTETAAYRANANHRLSQGADEAALSTFRRLVPTGDRILETWLRSHNGGYLFADINSRAAALRIFPVTTWELVTEEQRERHERFNSAMPDGLVFADIPMSGNYFYISYDAVGACSIVYNDHDRGDTPVARSFEEFLLSLFRDPPGFMIRYGCYTRYKDGFTNTQWIAKTYLPDIDASSEGKTCDDIADELLEGVLESNKRQYMPRDDELHLTRMIDALRIGIQRLTILNDIVVTRVNSELKSVHRPSLAFDRIFSTRESKGHKEREDILAAKDSVCSLLDSFLKENQAHSESLADEANLDRQRTLQRKIWNNCQAASAAIASLGVRTTKLLEFVAELKTLGHIPTNDRSARLDRRLLQWNSARDELAHKYAWLVDAVAERFKIVDPEIINGGHRGLRKAIDLYECKRGYSFAAYAIWWVRQGMIRARRDRS